MKAQKGVSHGTPCIEFKKQQTANLIDIRSLFAI